VNAAVGSSSSLGGDAVGESGLVYQPVRVAGGPAVDFCLDPGSGDPVALWLLEHGWIDEPVMRVFLSLVRPGSRVVDLGSHLGTFSLSAAAAGAQVISVDGSPRHADLLRRAADRNGLPVRAVHGAITGADAPAAMLGTSIHTRLARSDEAPHAAVREVPSVTVDALMRESGWDRVEVVKMDIEGNEPSALRGMERTFARGVRPAIVLECNAGLLPLFGSSPAALRCVLEELGYRLFQIDHLQPGTLVPTDATAVQTECVIDLLALPPAREVPSEWEVVPPFTLEQTVTRLLDQAASVSDGYRRHAAQTLAEGPEWLAAHPLAAPAVRALRSDLAAQVRAAMHEPRAQAPGRPGGPPPPESASPPADMALLVEGLVLARPTSEPDRPLGTVPAPHDILVRGADLHLRRGQLLGVLSDDAVAASELLRCLAGRRRRLAGHVHAPGRTVLVADLASVLEPGLTVRENAILYGAFLGADAREASRNGDELLHGAGLAAESDAPLHRCPADAVLRLAFAVALQWGQPSLLLIDRLPVCADEAFRAWLHGRTLQLRQSGVAIVQFASEPTLFISPPDRLLWLRDTGIAACGHPASVADAHARAALELWRTPATSATDSPRP